MQNNLKRLRKSRGLSQEAAAELMGTTRNQLAKLEAGSRRLSNVWIDRAARAFGVDPADIISDRGQPVPLISWVSAGRLAEVEGVEPQNDFETVYGGDLPPGKYIALAVEGDSMDRISPPGSTIFVDLGDKRLVPNACYVIADEHGGATYKRYRPNPDRWEPVSTNPDHEPLFPPPGGAPRIVGRVRKTVLSM